MDDLNKDLRTVMNNGSELALQDALNRRVFLSDSSKVMGAAALSAMLHSDRDVSAADASVAHAGLSGVPHFAPKAKRIIYLFQSGAPSQMDLFDPKPQLKEHYNEDLPDSIRKGQRLTTMTSGQSKFPVAPSIFKFTQHGESGMWLSELMPHMAKVADDFCMIRTMHTEAINHDPAITFFQTGNQLAGRPSIGAWASYGLGSVNQDLPAYVVLTSFGSGRPNDQPLYDRLWGAGFLPAEHQGVKFRNIGDPVLYLSNPPGVDRETRRSTLDRLAVLNGKRFEQVGDPEIQTRIAQYEMAFRMQTSVPDLLDVSDEPKHVLDQYGPDVTRSGSYASNCLLARRLAHCVGRRVWPDGVFAGRALNDKLRAGSSSAMLLRSDGRSRSQDGHDLRRDRRLLLQHCRQAGPCSRSERHNHAPARRRPHSADPSLSGPGFPADGYSRRSCQRRACLMHQRVLA
jgi:hypothetical protein